MSPRLMIILTIVFAWSAIVLVILAMIRRDGRTRTQAAPKYKPRHAATERIHAGGRYLATQPRRNSPPLTEQAIITTRPGRPWGTAPLPVAAAAYPHCEHCTDGKCTGPHQIPCADGCDDPAPLTDAATLAMYRGDWGVIPEGRNIAAEQLAKGLIALWMSLSPIPPCVPE